MDEARSRLDETDPLAGATLADALHLTREQGTGGQMRSAGDQVERNQLGQAGRAQEKARKDLAEMLDILANRREHELGRPLKNCVRRSRNWPRSANSTRVSATSGPCRRGRPPGQE